MTKEDIFISPTSDIFIKYLFGMDTDDSNQLVLSFINAVLEDADFQPVVKIIQKNPFNYRRKRQRVCPYRPSCNTLSGAP